jgi:hypothetical protein
MGYAGVVSSKHSSDERIRRGAIAKMGNAHLGSVASALFPHRRQLPERRGGALHPAAQEKHAQGRQRGHHAQHGSHAHGESAPA